MNGNSDRLRADDAAPTVKVRSEKNHRSVGQRDLSSSRSNSFSPPLSHDKIVSQVSISYGEEDTGQEASTKAPAASSFAPFPLQTLNLPHVLTYCLSSDLTTLLYCSPNVEFILGCPLHQIQTQGGILLRHVHPDDRFRVLNSVEQMIEDGEATTITYRWLSDSDSPDATPRLLLNHSTAVPSELGKIVVGIIVPLDATILADLPPELQNSTNTLEEASSRPSSKKRTLPKRNMLPTSKSELLLKSALPLASQLDDSIRLTLQVFGPDGPLPKNLSASTLLTLRKVFWSLTDIAPHADSLHITLQGASSEALQFSAEFKVEKERIECLFELRQQLVALTEKLGRGEKRLKITIQEEERRTILSLTLLSP